MCNDMDTLIAAINKLLSQTAKQALVKESDAWYLKNNLENYLDALKKSSTTMDIKKANHVFIHYCTDSSEWGSELDKECSKLTALGDKLWRQRAKEDREAHISE